MKNWKRVLTLTLCLFMVTALLPTVAFAKDEIWENGVNAITYYTNTANAFPEISITGLDKPVVGEAPDRTATVSNEYYRIETMAWEQYLKNGRFGKTWQVMKDGQKFAASGVYRCVFAVELAGGIRLPDSVTGLSATVNRRPAVISGSNSMQIRVEMYYYFSAEGKLRGNYIVTFDANGGSGTMSRAYVFAGDYYMLPMCTFIPPEGKQFKAWSVDGEEIDPGYIVMANSDIKVTALWVDHTCTPKGVARVEPTCVAEGKEAYYRCDYCGKSYEDANGTKVISDVAAWGILAKVDVHTDGNGDGKCDACGYKKHICTLEGIAKVEPTCVAEGKEAYYKCYGCGKAYEDEEATKVISDVAVWGVLAKTDHTPSDWTLDNKNHWQRCSITGCGAIIEGSREAHADGDGDGKCDTCGHKMNKTVQSAATNGEGDREGSLDPIPTAHTDEGESNNGLWWLWLLLAVPVAGGILVLVLVKRKKQL